MTTTGELLALPSSRRLARPRRRTLAGLVLATVAAGPIAAAPVVPEGTWSRPAPAILGTQIYPDARVLRLAALGAENYLAVYGRSGPFDLEALVLDAAGNPISTPVVLSSAMIDPWEVDVAASPDGDVAVAWTESGDGSGSAVWLRRFRPDGTERHGKVQVNETTERNQRAPSLAFDAAGNALVVWTHQIDRVSFGRFIEVARGRRLSPGGVALGPEVELSTGEDRSLRRVNVAAAPGGGYLLSLDWGIGLLPLAPDGAPTGPVVDAWASLNGGVQIASLLSVAGGVLGLAEEPEWLYTCPSDPTCASLVFNVGLAEIDPAGELGPTLPLDDNRAQASPAAAVHASGSVLTAWMTFNGIEVRWSSPDLGALSDTLELGAAGGLPTTVTVAANRRGDALVAWLSAGPTLGSSTVQLHRAVFDGVAPVVSGPDRDGDSIPDADDGCPGVADPTQADLDGDGAGDACDCAELDGTDAALCVGPQKRFRIDVEWATATSAGLGVPLSLTPDTLAFWFFAPENLELLVKVLDGCAINDHWWVFAGGLTNVAVALRVEDQVSGVVATYVNPAGTAYQPVQDTSAIPCP